jgi:hypothetical protein
VTAVPLHDAAPHGLRWPGGDDAGRFYTGHQTAAAVGLSWERFRKVRTLWTRDRDFPAEINEPGEPVRYLATAVDRWVLNRSRRVHLVAGLADTADPAASIPAEARAAASQGRARLRALKGD